MRARVRATSTLTAAPALAPGHGNEHDPADQRPRPEQKYRLPDGAHLAAQADRGGVDGPEDPQRQARVGADGRDGGRDVEVLLGEHREQPQAGQSRRVERTPGQHGGPRQQVALVVVERQGAAGLELFGCLDLLGEQFQARSAGAAPRRGPTGRWCRPGRRVRRTRTVRAAARRPRQGRSRPTRSGNPRVRSDPSPPAPRRRPRRPRAPRARPGRARTATGSRR